MGEDQQSQTVTPSTHWHFGFQLLLTTAAAIGFFAVGLKGPSFVNRRKGKGASNAQTLFAWSAAAAGGVLLAYKAAFFIPGVTQRFPEMPDILASGIFLLIGSAAYLVGATAVCEKKIEDPNRSKRLLAILFGLAVLCVFERPVYMTIQGPKLAKLNGPFQDGVCLQSTSFTCVSASGASALASMGIEATEGELAILTGTTWRGTGFDRFQKAAKILAEREGMPLEVQSRALTWEDLSALKSPALLETLWKGLVHHSTAFLGMTNGLAILGEPMEGRLLVTRDELTGAKWNWEGKAHVLVRKP